MKSNIMQIRLKEERKKIDKIDRNLIILLDQQAEIALRVGKIKTQNNFAIQDLSREKQVLEKTSLARNKLFVENIFKIFIHESKIMQDNLK
ncbi:hypothetical protein COU57_06625 [Candidatus Pacearchaeota archaeon CG10_big_fil_rev_8_21_14_0_10_32_14]|nr:MAG: hypothetical protein COU57_06625 [Candidatus Pacearchaeota archaeon CG10_big_fil_rev_8_21_14_0_10_32_14]